MSMDYQEIIVEQARKIIELERDIKALEAENRLYLEMANKK